MNFYLLFEHFFLFFKAHKNVKRGAYYHYDDNCMLIYSKQG